MKLLCPEHGLTEEVEQGRCKACGLTALDPQDPANAEAVAAARGWQETKAPAAWKLAAGFLALCLAFFVIAVFAISGMPSAELAQIVTLGVVCVAVVAVMVARLVASRRRDWGDRLPLRRWLLSATLISFVLCLAFVGVAMQVGLPALWFGADHLSEPWRIVTASLAHGGPVHFLSNMLVLAIFGPAIELRVGRPFAALLLACAAIAGALAHAATSAVPAVGFSGALYGLFGATLVLLPTRPQVLAISGFTVPMPTWAWMLVIVPLYTILAITQSEARVAWVAHLGGFAAGAILAFPMRRLAIPAAYRADENRRRDQLARSARLSGLGAQDLFDAPAEPTPAAASTDPEVDAFHRAARRHRTLVSTIGGASMLVLGLAATILATAMEAPSRSQGRRITIIMIGLVITVVGLATLGRVLFGRRRAD